jgi:hypothetical protein
MFGKVTKLLLNAEKVEPPVKAKTFDSQSTQRRRFITCASIFRDLNEKLAQSLRRIVLITTCLET